MWIFFGNRLECLNTIAVRQTKVEQYDVVFFVFEGLGGLGQTLSRANRELNGLQTGTKNALY